MLPDSLDETYHVNMLVDLLVRFPEICTINFNVPSSSCSLSYMIKRQLNRQEFKDLQQQVRENLQALYFLSGCENCGPPKTQMDIYPGITRVQIVLKGDTLLEEAISLLTKTISSYFKTDLAGESPPDKEGCLPSMAAPPDDLSSRSTAGAGRRTSHFFAYRDEGKVYIYDK